MIKNSTIKVVLLGDSSVGKTCIFERLKNNEFPMDQIATIGADKSDIKFTLEKGKEINIIYFIN